MKIFKLWLILLPFTSLSVMAQSQLKVSGEIDAALANQNFSVATSLLQSAINRHSQLKQADSLVEYIFITGKVYQQKESKEEAIKQINLLFQKIKNLGPSSSALKQAHIEAGEFYGSVGMNNQAYTSNKQAFIIAKQDAQSFNQLGKIENNLATYAQRLGDLSLSRAHQRNAFQNILKDKSPDYETLYIAYNGMGSSMWYASKNDSALFYFNLALETLYKTERTPINEFYRPAILQNNMSALHQAKGNTTAGINAMRSTINLLDKFINSKDPHPKKVTAKTFRLEATDNLAGIYKELGDLKMAQNLLEYSYQQKLSSLEKDDPAIFISQILLGQLYYAVKDFPRAKRFLENGLKNIKTADGDYLFWQADACNTLALLYDEQKSISRAALFYEKADSLYEESLQGSYDNIYLDFLRNAAIFYAENQRTDLGVAKARKGLDYVLGTMDKESLPVFYQLLNLSEVHFLSGDYRKAMDYSRQGLEVMNKSMRNSQSLLDSVKIELKKPKAILLKTKAAYALLPLKDSAALQPLVQEINSAIQSIEKRKAIISDPEDIGLIMADHHELLEFLKKLNLDLYKLSGDKAYIERVMSLHESGMYTRIRARLDKNDSLQFAHLPESILKKERQLKHNLLNSLSGTMQHEKNMNTYFSAVKAWDVFQQDIKKNYPGYYKMRYASIFKSLDDIQNSVPENTTLIRYFFVDKDLFALVADKTRKNVVLLNDNSLVSHISDITSGMDVSKTSNALQSLYKSLWAPLVKDIRFKKIIIVPDGILYKLNFEILTPKPIINFRELATNSLLADHTISYRYSLFLLENTLEKKHNRKDFIAFAPGFSDNDKKVYQASAQNLGDFDKSYLSLLPQPFTVRLVERAKTLFEGNAFTKNESTVLSFRKNAGQHKIIHIGTHAESNNINPEYSRLIFAKNPASAKEDNSLYLDDIYNCDLTSNLTVLTACESGRPGYLDGEGMISLAHAFNYAGSESILTGLWKIDEQSSAILMDYFYQFLLQGLDKDEALRKAKIKYLSQAEGRMAAPPYWAGLVIMGDTSPVELNKAAFLPYKGIMAAVALIFVAGYTISKRRRKQIKIHTSTAA